MSAYIVKDQTINRIVNWLSREVDSSLYIRKETEEIFGNSLDEAEWGKAVGQALFRLNIDAVNTRYTDAKAQKTRTLNFEYIPYHPSVRFNSLSAKTQVLKSMQCFLFKCMEGEIVKNPLYRFLREVVEPHLMRSIIYDLPEYQEAEWG